jgi:DnaJ-class molecular chaperone
LAGEGMPIHGNSFNFGQLFVTFQINFPAKLTDQQKEGFKTLLQ